MASSESHSEDVLEWLHNSNLKSLVPIFEREQLTDWNCFSRLSIPLLQSLNIPLGTIFKLENALKGLKKLRESLTLFVCEEKRPDLRLSLHRDNDVKKIASSLFEWIRESQKNIDKQRAKQRPPWLGTTEKQRSFVSNGFPPLENASNSKKENRKVSAVSRKKEEKLGTPPKLRSITGVVSFPETSKIKRKPGPKIAPVPRVPSVSYPSIDDEILRYHREIFSSESNDANLPIANKVAATALVSNTDKEKISVDTSFKVLSNNLQKPTILNHSIKESTATLYEPDFEDYVQGEIRSGKGKIEASKVAIKIEEREKTPKEMFSTSSSSMKRHPKTIDPFSRKLKRLSAKSPYVK